jgi:hypothetical protein
MSNRLYQLPLPLPEALRQWLTVNIEFHVVLCHDTDCQHALTPASTSRHLRDKHQAKVEAQRQADEYIKQWQWSYDFRSVPLPLDQSLPQLVLPVLRGFQCTKCGFTSQSRKVLQIHGLKEHDQKRLKDKQLFKPVQVQTWFGQKRARYWVVDASGESRDVNNGQGGGSGSDNKESRDAGVAIKAKIEEWLNKEEEEYKVSTIATEIDPWLQYTGWEEVLAGSKHSLVKTAEFTAIATADEPELERVLQSWERIVQRSLATLAAVSQYKDILKWWASPKNEAASQKPFELP